MVIMQKITNGKCHKSQKSPLTYGIDAKYHHWQMSLQAIAQLAYGIKAKYHQWQMSLLAYGIDA